MRDFNIVHDFYYMLFLPLLVNPKQNPLRLHQYIVINVMWYFMKCCGDFFGDASMNEFTRSGHPDSNFRSSNIQYLKQGWCILHHNDYVMKYCHVCLKMHLVVSDHNCNIVALYHLFFLNKE